MPPTSPTIILDQRGQTLKVVLPPMPPETRRPLGFQPPKPKGGSK